ncbi:pyridoxal phosphate-dependent transferase [Tuber brumale]|nr:pyridoxal phosphate-dependent transferase [Tuber brumale]
MDEGSQPSYLDMQATTHTAPRVLDAILSIYSGLYGNPHSHTHTYGWKTEKVIGVIRELVAKLNGAHPKGILFTSGATGLDDTSIKYVVRLYKSKKHVVRLQAEHKDMLDLCRHLQDEGYGVTHLPIKNNRLINLEHLEEICPDTALVSIMMVNNEIEVIEQMEEIGKLYRKQGVCFHTNGAWVMGEIPVEVGRWNVGWMNIFGPRVCGLKRIRACYIFCRLKVRIGLLISGGGQGRGLRSGARAPSLVIRFGEVCRIAQEEIEAENYMRKSYYNKQPKQFTRTFRTTSHNMAGTKKGKRKATTKDSIVGIPEANLTKVPNSKAAEDTTNKRRSPKWVVSYSKITIREAEKRLGLRLDLCGIPVERMLEGKHVLLGPDITLKLKRKIYQDLENYIRAEGYPTEANVDFKEANINDIVAFTIIPIVAQFTRETKRKLRLSREKEITSKDCSTSGMEEFVVMDYISYDEMKYVLVVEAKRAALGEAIKQCFLALKDIRDLNGGGTVYGFVTMGDSWRMISFNGTFTLSNKIELLFDTMGESEEEWMADYSTIVDCLNVALSDGWKDPVEVV